MNKTEIRLIEVLTLLTEPYASVTGLQLQARRVLTKWAQQDLEELEMQAVADAEWNKDMDHI